MRVEVPTDSPASPNIGPGNNNRASARGLKRNRPICVPGVVIYGNGFSVGARVNDDPCPHTLLILAHGQTGGLGNGS